MKIRNHSGLLIFFFLLLRISMADDQVRVRPDGVAIVTLGECKTVNEMAVYPGGGIPNRPLLVMAHGNGGSGPSEVAGWMDLAQQHNFTIVCPTFLSAVHVMHVPEDVPYFADCLRWIEHNLQYDKTNAYMSGASGGGFAVWYLGTTRPDFFKGLFLQSGNFAGDYFGLNLSRWQEKPIKLMWGSQDLPDIPIQNQQAVALLKSEDCKNYSVEVVPGGRHEEHPNRVVAWMEYLTSTMPARKE